MAMIATLYDNGRSAERHALGADATVRGADQVPVDVLVADLSRTGCLFMSTEPLVVDGIITIGVAGIGRREARIVRAEEPRFGCVFLGPLTDDELAAGLAASETIAPFPAAPRGAGVEDQAADTRFPPRAARLAAIVGIAIVSWGLVLAALTRLV